MHVIFGGDAVRGHSLCLERNQAGSLEGGDYCGGGCPVRHVGLWLFYWFFFVVVWYGFFLVVTGLGSIVEDLVESVKYVLSLGFFFVVVGLVFVIAKSDFKN